MRINVAEYLRLPEQIRADFDAWLEREGLRDKGIRDLELGEGYVDAECLCRNEQGQRFVIDGNVATEMRRFSVSTLPPAEAFARG